ncbi:MAG: hypothetical protein Q7U88_06240 [Desulfocapsaceae bacterium]|nr:hypothetical protein [Desulfocapsaceae bacterium]
MILIDIRDLISKRLNISQWTIETQQHWCLIGTTGSGKSQLARIFRNLKKWFFNLDSLKCLLPVCV